MQWNLFKIPERQNAKDFMNFHPNKMNAPELLWPDNFVRVRHITRRWNTDEKKIMADCRSNNCNECSCAGDGFAILQPDVWVHISFVDVKKTIYDKNAIVVDIDCTRLHLNSLLRSRCTTNAIYCQLNWERKESQVLWASTGWCDRTTVLRNCFFSSIILAVWCAVVAGQAENGQSIWGIVFQMKIQARMPFINICEFDNNVTA